jgi:glyoxylase-like metal-dependent hydrolase (beta-lactamase superfamily II)
MLDQAEGEIMTTAVKYEDGIYGLEQQRVRAFLIIGTESALLLDTGAIEADLPGMIRQITDLPLTVVLTHRDGDHLANLPLFSKAYIHEKDLEAAASQLSLSNTELLPLKEGEVFQLGGRSLSVIHTPGHTPGSICLLDEENRALFSGDTVSYGPVYMFGGHRDFPSYIDSLRRLDQQRARKAFDRVFCCHNSCPISPDVILDLISCAEGIMDHTIQGSPVVIHSGMEVLLGTVGKAGIYYL